MNSWNADGGLSSVVHIGGRYHISEATPQRRRFDKVHTSFWSARLATRQCQIILGLLMADVNLITFKLCRIDKTLLKRKAAFHCNDHKSQRGCRRLWVFIWRAGHIRREGRRSLKP